RTSSVDPAELERFSRYAADWWNPRGSMAPLHKFNPVRLAYIRDQVAARFNRDAKKLDCLKGLCILDIGCGGGILSEPLARLGAKVLGGDPSGGNMPAGAASCQNLWRAWGRKSSGRIRRRRISLRRARTPRGRALMSTTARPRRRHLPMQTNDSTSCWLWKSSSTLPTLERSSTLAQQWSNQADL